MIVRHIERHEFDGADRIKHIAFGRKLTSPVNDADDPDFIYQSVVVCCDDDGAMTARARNIDFHCMFDGRKVPMAGLSGVSSLPQSRNLGRVRAIIEYLFCEDRERGIVLSALFPFSHGYYRKFGYEITGEQQLVRMPTSSLRSYADSRFEVRMHDMEDGFADIRTVSTAFNARYNLGMLLDDRQFKKALGGDALMHGDYRYILTQNGAPCAYLYFTDEESKEGVCTANVQVLEYVDLRGLLCALGFLYGLRARYDFVKLPLPKDVSFLPLMPEPREAEATFRPYGMARILDVEKALKLMRHPKGSGRYSILVRDDILKENEGVYSVAFGEHEVEVNRTGSGAPDMTLDIGTLTQLVLGYSSFLEARIKPGVAVRQNEQTLSAVFLRKPTYLSFHF